MLADIQLIFHYAGIDYCGDPGVPVHGNRSFNGTSLGSTVSYSCPTGYRLVGPTVRQCQINRRWSGNLPQCNSELST